MCGMERESENNLLCSPAFFSFKGVSALLKNGVVGGGAHRPFFRFLSDLRNQQDQQERDFFIWPEFSKRTASRKEQEKK